MSMTMRDGRVSPDYVEMVGQETTRRVELIQKNERLTKAIGEALWWLSREGHTPLTCAEQARNVLSDAINGESAPEMVEVPHPETGEPVLVPADQDEREEWSRG